MGESRGGMALAITHVIKYEGDNQSFIWKHPCEDFNTGSQLIVHESQEAIFFMNGQALDSFGPGRYTLETQNLPLVGKLFKLTTGGVSAFHCEVYFINKTEQMAIRWGTDSRVTYVEPTYQFPISIGACGEMSLRVQEPRKLLIRLVGTEYYLSQDKLKSYFRAMMMARIKTYMAQVMKANKINIFEIDENMERFSEEIREKLAPDFAEYGMVLEQFYVTTLSKPDGDPQYERFKQLHFRQYADVAEAKLQQQLDIIEQQTRAQRMVIESQGIAQKRAIEGYSYQEERGFDVAERVAANEGVGEFANMGVGLGVMAGVGGAVGNTFGNTLNQALGAAGTPAAAQAPAGDTAQQPDAFCANCGNKLTAGALFCDECGTPVAPAQPEKCANCGFVFEKPGKFCPKCGTRRDG